MTIADLLPVRLGVLRRVPRTRHRAIDEVDRLRLKLQWADSLIKAQRVQIQDAEAKQAEAEELVIRQQADIDDLTAERDELLAEVLRFRTRFGAQLAAEANANRITVPCGYRDTTAIEDQATGPIDVRPLWEARDAGILRPVTDPGRIR